MNRLSRLNPALACIRSVYVLCTAPVCCAFVQSMSNAGALCLCPRGAPLRPCSVVQTPDAWLPLQRTYGAVWEVSGVPDAPLDLRASDGSGQQVVARCAL